MAQPIITGTKAGQATTNDAAIDPFSDVTITDPNQGATDTLTISLGGASGTLSGDGLSASSPTAYTLTGPAAQITSQLQALVFKPSAGQPGAQRTTRFTLTDSSNAGPPAATDSNTTVIDSDTPAAPGAPRLAASSDSGVSNSDGVTDVSAPVVTGTAHPGASVTIYDGGNVVGQGMADSQTGTYSIQISGLAQGANALAAQQTLHGLTSAVGATRTVTLDTTSPSIVSLKESGAGISASGSGDIGTSKKVTFSLATSEPVYVSGGTPSLTLNDGGVATYTGGSGKNLLTFAYTVAAGQNTPALAVTGLSANGASLTDKAGNPLNVASLNTAAMPAGPLVVNTTAPIVAITSAGGLVAGSTTAVRGSVSNADANTRVSITDNGGTKPVAGAKVGADGSFSIPVKLLAGQNALSITATNAAGNVSQPANVSYDDSPASVRADQTISYANGAFTIDGTATAAAGVKGVEITADVGGKRQSLGAATLQSDGSFSFTDPVGAGTQTRMRAVETTTLGQTVVAPIFSDLTGGITGEPYVARQDRYDPASGAFAGQTFFGADGSVVYNDSFTGGVNGTATYSYSGGTYFSGKDYDAFSDVVASDGQLLSETQSLNGGGHTVSVDASNQTLTSEAFDTFYNGGQVGTTFVFDPGHGLDVVDGFRIGAGHDTLSLQGSDFGNSIAAVLHDTQNTAQGALITDPTTKDTVVVSGVTKAQLAQNRNAFSFHG